MGQGTPAPASEREAAHFRALVEVTSDWLWEVDAEGRYTFSNPKVVELLGYEVHEVLGKRPFDFMAPAEAKRVEAVFSAIKADRAEFHELVNVNRHRAGHEVVMETSGVPIFGDDGAFLGYRGIDRDVTQRTNAERRLLLADAAVKASAEGIIVADTSGRITAVNPAWATMSGIPESAQLGRQPSMLSATDSTRARLWALLDGAPKWSGEGTCRHHSGETFPVWMTLSAVHDDAQAVSGYVALVSDMTERRAAEATVRFQANHDAVTQLANRNAFLSTLTRAIAEGARTHERIAVLFIDLDGFKPVNDQHGHGVGDVLLATTARRLERCVRRTDLVARFGGDEFTILLRGLSDDAVPRRVAAACVKALAAPYRLEGLQVRVGASIGVALCPKKGTADTLVAAADAAMYEAKRAGGSRVVVSGSARRIDKPKRRAKAKKQRKPDLKPRRLPKKRTSAAAPALRR
ncbi:MAG: diguanylate cyclase [Myxococcales bacterium]|nr:diguanylate cyclase [Myxococcales bacterium]